jgi:hypothetical protein
MAGVATRYFFRLICFFIFSASSLAGGLSLKLPGVGQDVCTDVVYTVNPNEITVTDGECLSIGGSYSKPSLTNSAYTHVDSLQEGGGAVTVPINGIVKTPTSVHIEGITLVQGTALNLGTAVPSGDRSGTYTPPSPGNIGGSDTYDNEYADITVKYRLVDANNNSSDLATMTFRVYERPGVACISGAGLICQTLEWGGNYRLTLNPGVTYAFEFQYNGTKGGISWVGGSWAKHARLSEEAGDPDVVSSPDLDYRCEVTTKEGGLLFGSGISYYCGNFISGNTYFLNVKVVGTTSDLFDVAPFLNP